MEVPGLGEVTKDERFGWYYSQPIAVPMLGGKPCRIVLEDYDGDERKEDFHVAIANFLSAPPSVLRDGDEPLFRYYKDCAEWVEGDLEPITNSDQLWSHVRIGDEPMLTRRANGDKGIYVSLDCNCDWEREHGLQIVLKNGLKINKLGPYDGHLTNSDSYDNPKLENVVYRGR
jgi:hypothetical protein